VLFRSTGRVTLPLGGPGLADLELTAKGFHVSLANLGEVVTDARLKLQGPTDAPRLTGLLTPRRAVIQPRLATPDIQRDVVILKPGQKPPPVRREVRRAPRIQLEGPLAPLVMDVDMEMTPDLKVRVGDGFLDMLGVASVRKSPGGPLTFHGGAGVPRGLIIVQGKRFELSDGSTDLRGKDRPDPDISAKATLRLGTSLVVASVSGTAYEPQIDLSSEPPMSQADILSTIIFGRPANALNAGETRQLSAQALALMGQRGRREIEKLLGPTLSPDVVTVHSEMQSGSSLEAGKYLSPDLYLRYRQNMGQEGGQNVGLELRLKPYLSLESQLGTTRDNGVDVIFSFDFD
jgi:translocation and assembly module TamB